MKKKRLLFLGLLLTLCCGLSKAQEFNVMSFQKMERDLTARVKERLDLKGNPCAVVRVRVPEADNFVFEGNVIGTPVYSDGEVLVYMPTGSEGITIKSRKYGTTEYQFSDTLQKQVTYQLDLKLRYKGEYRTRTLVMPVYSYGQDDIHSYGIMIGVVRKIGGYIKGKTNLDDGILGRDYAYECNSEGIVNNGQKTMYGSEIDVSRFAVTGGVLYRVSLPLYLYGGIGYGFKDVYWSLDNYYAGWARSKDDSAKGVEFEVGSILRLSGLALTAGVQTCAFKHWDITVGFGFMF